jgi:116 kDa U5 small nuclear ribonucleoprotein component
MQGSILMEHASKCAELGPIVAFVGKLYPKSDCSAFDAFTRIFSGSIKVGDKVRVLGESYTPDDEEDSAVAEISNIWVLMGRYRIAVHRAQAGENVLAVFAKQPELLACSQTLAVWNTLSHSSTHD